ncbi:hypothetical protein F5887DRAFT_1068775 [Amanita rubescens]|nr:hypothetical protein F5887DRAFT_1068775 [Amanita rubescens]
MTVFIDVTILAIYFAPTNLLSDQDLLGNNHILNSAGTWLSACLLDEAKRRCRDSLVRAVKNYSQPTERPPLLSEHFFPINRLPQDVLAEIFVQCLPKIELWYSSAEGPPTEDVAPLLLCSVCSSWRKLVLSVPRLWQRLSIRFANEISKSRTEEVIALIHGWIKRSGVLPLALSLVSHRSQAIVEAVLGAFVQYASRWEHFHYCCTDVISAITFPEFGDLPHLRSFSLHEGCFEDAKLQISSWPMLTALSWPLNPTASSSPSLPWDQLTHLTLEHFMTARETLLVIQYCPKLTELEIDSYDDRGDIQDQPPCGIAVVNNCLRRLALIVEESCAWLLRRLTLPVLTDMAFHFDSCVPRVHKELLLFFTRSKCKLDRLHLKDPA